MTGLGRRPMALTLAVFVGSTLAAVAAEQSSRTYKRGEYNPNHESVDVFEAIADGKVDVKLIAKDSTQAKVVITNKTPQPLNVKLPDAFAGVHVLAQLGGGMMGGGGGGGGFGQGQAVGTGGGGMMGGGGMGGAGGGGGMFNVPAEKVGEFNVACACLEHGKPEPRSTMKYEIRPLESVTTKPGVREICSRLGKGQINQRVAQAALWHLNNDMSWAELAAKEIKPLLGDPYPYFQPYELGAAVTLVDQAQKAEAEQKANAKTTPSVSPGEREAARTSAN
ncbi:MAG TPA: hypothetical protein VG713_02455 [Pirellulales bacterium]|nr:hypothetical protein [Pirellulales bacterium]